MNKSARGGGAKTKKGGRATYLDRYRQKQDNKGKQQYVLKTGVRHPWNQQELEERRDQVIQKMYQEKEVSRIRIEEQSMQSQFYKDDYVDLQMMWNKKISQLEEQTQKLRINDKREQRVILILQQDRQSKKVKQKELLLKLQELQRRLIVPVGFQQEDQNEMIYRELLKTVEETERQMGELRADRIELQGQNNKLKVSVEKLTNQLSEYQYMDQFYIDELKFNEMKEALEESLEELQNIKIQNSQISKILGQRQQQNRIQAEQGKYDSNIQEQLFVLDQLQKLDKLMVIKENQIKRGEEFQVNKNFYRNKIKQIEVLEKDIRKKKKLAQELTDQIKQKAIDMLTLYQCSLIFISYLREMFSVEEIRENMVKHCPGWNAVQVGKIKVEKMTGITNLTFKVTVEGDQLAPVIYRKFGQSEENIFLSRKEESCIYKILSDVGVGPKLFYADQHFRLEEFFESTVLEAKNMLVPGYLQEVAISLSQFHRIKPQQNLISPQNLIRKNMINRKQKILKICTDKLSKKIYNAEEQPPIQLLKTWVTGEQLQFVEGVIQKYEKEPLVFSHNDLLANNVLILKKDGIFRFIDYEYGCFNFPVFDIANYFEESLFDYDVEEPPYYTIRVPKEGEEEMKRRFIDAYNISMDVPREKFKQNFEVLRKEAKYIERGEKMYANLVLGSMLCSLSWGWWAIIVSKNPQINFDYIKFAKYRYDRYQACKKLLTK